MNSIMLCSGGLKDAVPAGPETHTCLHTRAWWFPPYSDHVWFCVIRLGNKQRGVRGNSELTEHRALN